MLEEFEWVIRFALTARFLVGRRAARRMVDQGRGGRIVFITSIHELVPLETATAYTAAKHGTGGLMKACRSGGRATPTRSAPPRPSYITGETLVVDGGMNLMAAMANQLAQ